MTLIDDYIVDCQLRGIRYPKTAIYYIQDFATTCEDLQNANRADLKRYLAVLRGRNLKQSSIMKAYNHLSGFYRGNIEYIDNPEVRGVLPYRCSAEEYLGSDRSKAFMAFLVGQDWVPSTYEYGTNAGDYSSPLESRGGELWYHNVRQGCATKSALIARRVEEVA